MPIYHIIAIALLLVPMNSLAVGSGQIDSNSHVFPSGKLDLQPIIKALFIPITSIPLSQL